MLPKILWERLWVLLELRLNPKSDVRAGDDVAVLVPDRVALRDGVKECVKDAQIWAVVVHDGVGVMLTHAAATSGRGGPTKLMLIPRLTGSASSHSTERRTPL